MVGRATTRGDVRTIRDRSPAVSLLGSHGVDLSRVNSDSGVPVAALSVVVTGRDAGDHQVRDTNHPSSSRSGTMRRDLITRRSPIIVGSIRT
jgi:hypothetical protein